MGERAAGNGTHRRQIQRTALALLLAGVLALAVHPTSRGAAQVNGPIQISLRLAQLGDGGSYEVTIHAQNAGSATATRTFEVEEQPPTGGSFAVWNGFYTLAPGQSREATFIWTPSGVGTHTLLVDNDPTTAVSVEVAAPVATPSPTPALALVTGSACVTISSPVGYQSNCAPPAIAALDAIPELMVASNAAQVAVSQGRVAAAQFRNTLAEASSYAGAGLDQLKTAVAMDPGDDRDAAIQVATSLIVLSRESLGAALDDGTAYQQQLDAARQALTTLAQAGAKAAPAIVSATGQAAPTPQPQAAALASYATFNRKQLADQLADLASLVPTAKAIDQANADVVDAEQQQAALLTQLGVQP